MGATRDLHVLICFDQILLGGKGIPTRWVHNRQAFTAGPSCQAFDQCSDGVYTNRGSTKSKRLSEAQTLQKTVKRGQIAMARKIARTKNLYVSSGKLLGIPESAILTSPMYPA